MEPIHRQPDGPSPALQRQTLTSVMLLDTASVLGTRCEAEQEMLPVILTTAPPPPHPPAAGGLPSLGNARLYHGPPPAFHSAFYLIFMEHLHARH